MSIIEGLNNDLIAFGKVITPRMFNKPSPMFHYDLSDLLLDKKKKFLNIIAPRGTAKSTITGVINPLHHIVESPKERRVVVLVSRTQGHAINLLQSIKDILEYSMEFRQLYGYWGVNSARKWTSTEVILKNGSAIVCKGMGQMLRGLNIGGQRPTLIILDDPEDENNTKTSEAMEANLRWLLQAAEPALDATIGRLQIIGTPLHERCLVWTLKEYGRYETMHIHYIEKDEEGREYSIWEEMKSLEELKKELKDLEGLGRSSVWWRERQCEIKYDDDQLFRKSDFRYYDGDLEVLKGNTFLRLKEIDGEKKEELLPINVFMGIDPASSTATTADFSVVFFVGFDKEKRIFILPYYRKRVQPVELGNTIIQLAKMRKPVKAGIETIGFQEMLRDYLKQEMESQGIYIAGLNRTEGFKPRTEKNERLSSLQPLFVNHRVFMKKDMRDLEDELLLYPRSKHDDLMDGFYYATRGMYPPEHSKPVQKESFTFKEEKSWMAI